MDLKIIKMETGMKLSNKDLTKLPSLAEKMYFFDCSHNKLRNLNGSPKEVEGHFDCSNNYLTNLAGSPGHVGGSYYCSGNMIKNLDGSPIQVLDFFCCKNHLTSLFGAPKIINGYLSINRNPNLLDISNIWDSDIGKSIFFDFQYDLIENGYEDNAKWKP